jgi:hypothetical protein
VGRGGVGPHHAISEGLLHSTFCHAGYQLVSSQWARPGSEVGGVGGGEVVAEVVEGGGGYRPRYTFTTHQLYNTALLTEKR